MHIHIHIFMSKHFSIYRHGIFAYCNLFHLYDQERRKALLCEHVMEQDLMLAVLKRRGGPLMGTNIEHNMYHNDFWSFTNLSGSAFVHFHVWDQPRPWHIPQSRCNSTSWSGCRSRFFAFHLSHTVFFFAGDQQLASGKLSHNYGKIHHVIAG